jgi:hypothetical protein
MKSYPLGVQLILAAPLCAQIEIGVHGGVPLNHFILDRVDVRSAPRRYTVGPYMAFPAYGRVTIDAGVLYKRFGFDTAYRFAPLGATATEVFSRTTGNSWEFPILAKVRFRLLPRLRGFITAGPSVRRLTGIRESGIRTFTPFQPPRTIRVDLFETENPDGMNRRTSFGMAFGGGVQFSAGPIRIEPAVRMTRWDTERTATGPALSRLGRTQIDVLLGVGRAIGPDLPSKASHLPCCIEIGLLAGVPLLPAYRVERLGPVPVTIDAPTRRFAAGAVLGWRFHPRWSVEGSFLVRRFGHVEAGPATAQTITGNVWETPLELKWRSARIRNAQVVLGLGPALRRASHFQNVVVIREFRSVFGAPISSRRTTPGMTASAGLEIPTGGIRFRPELRFSWFDRPLYEHLPATPRQAALYGLLGITWSGRK